MTFILSSQNATRYLVSVGLCKQIQIKNLDIKPVAGKNFNLIITCKDNQKLLIKQERHNRQGKTSGEFRQEYQIQKLLQNFPQLNHLRTFIPSMLHFDIENSIIIFKYSEQHLDLADFYKIENLFPDTIPKKIGNILATFHCDTFNSDKYRDSFTKNTSTNFTNLAPNIIRNLEHITPDIFGNVPTDALKFVVLYQRYDSLKKAIAQLGDSFKASCITHNDLKLNNILLHTDWENSQKSVRFIDWERSDWGDPAFDLGILIGSYLQIWLNGIVIGKTIPLEESLRLATTPLEVLQPSIAALTLAYLERFPQIIQHRPDFVLRVVQFAGLTLIQQIQAIIQYQKTFNNTGICMLQVAKNLLCNPEQSMPTIFGTDTSTKLTPLCK